MNTKGVLLFAFNNGSIDYVKLANQSAVRIKKYLGLPTSVVTDEMLQNGHNFDSVILAKKPDHGIRHFSDKGRVNWHNHDRCDAYDLSPYDETLLLDVDYLVNSNQLKILFELNKDFLCHTTSINVTGQSFESSNSYGLFDMRMDWATVVYFKKTEISKSIFLSWKMVQENYNHYAELYQFKKRPFRNDYALSIALNINKGHFINSNEYYIPWNLPAVMPYDEVYKISEDTFDVVYNLTPDKQTHIIIKDQDLHIMGKSYLEKIYE